VDCHDLLEKTDIVSVDPLSVLGRNFTVNNVCIAVSYGMGLSVSEEGVIFGRSIIGGSR